MAKTKTAFFCNNCGAQASKWVGKCNACGQWNTYVEEIVSKAVKPFSNSKNNKVAVPVSIADIASDRTVRFTSHDKEFDRVLGGGIVPGSLVLIGGEPGIGKSTLLLQIALLLKDRKTLYVTGEESAEQIKLRADRINSQNLSCLILTETNTQNILQQTIKVEPEVIIIDSIQTLYTSHLESSPGTVSQIRECTAELIQYAKTTNTPVFLIGHITKDGQIAGPKILEHMVDTVLQFEGDRNHVYRLLRSTKNRFGSTNELGIYEMVGSGLRQVENPSEILISNKNNDLSGVAIGAIMEGLRPLLIETQALVSSAAFGTPQRSVTGFDLRRLNMLLAVLEKRCGFKLAAKDVFLNITGGIKVLDIALDLSVICSVLSSSEDISVDMRSCFSAEVGLSGEIRPVSRIEQRIGEAQKLGFQQIYISNANLKGLDVTKYKIEIKTVSKIEQVFEQLFG